MKRSFVLSVGLIFVLAFQVALAKSEVRQLTGSQLNISIRDQVNQLTFKLFVQERDSRTVYVEYQVSQFNGLRLEFGRGNAPNTILNGSFNSKLRVLFDTAMLDDLVIFTGNGGIVDVIAEKIPSNINSEIHGTTTHVGITQTSIFQGTRVLYQCDSSGYMFSYEMTGGNCRIDDNQGVLTIKPTK